MHTTKAIQGFNETELRKQVPQNASWHEEFKDSAYVFIGGLNYEMNEGDVAIVFSQFGEIVDVRLMRDKATGKFRGFGFLAYEDQRSTVLAVDNLNGAEICGRTIRVDHIKKFKPPREFIEVKEDENGNEIETIYKPSGPDGRGWGQYRDYTEEELEAMRQDEEDDLEVAVEAEKKYDQIQERKKKIMFDEDERWERMLMNQMDDDTEAAKEQKAIKDQIKQEMKKRKKLEKKLKKGKKDKKDKKEKKAKKDKKENNDDDNEPTGKRTVE